MNSRRLWTGSFGRCLVITMGLMTIVCGFARAQTPSLRTTTEYVLDGSAVARGTLENPPGVFQFFTMKPYTGARRAADNNAAPLPVAFMVQTFMGKDPGLGRRR